MDTPAHQPAMNEVQTLCGSSKRALEASLDADDYCAICQDDLLDPNTSPSGHNFYQKCEQDLRASNVAQRCPSFREDIPRAKLRVRFATIRNCFARFVTRVLLVHSREGDFRECSS